MVSYMTENLTESVRGTYTSNEELLIKSVVITWKAYRLNDTANIKWTNQYQQTLP